MILYQHRSASRIARIAARLGGIGTEVLTSSRGATTGCLAAIAIIGAIAHRVWHLRGVAAGLLCGRIQVGHAMSCGTVGVRCVALGSLRNVAHAGASRSCACVCNHERGNKGEQDEDGHREIRKRRFTHVLLSILTND